MKYWVHVNKPTSRAIIHKESCVYCNEGRGCHGVSKPTYSKWYSFHALNDAKDYAHKSGKKIKKGCDFCLPNVGSL